MKKAALYDPYLDVLGGGEKYLLSMLKVLEDMGYETTIFWDKNISRQIQERLHLDFSRTTYEKNIFQDKNMNAFQRFLRLRDFEVFLYISDGSYFFSGAKKNFVHAMVPLRSLYNRSPLNSIKHVNWNFIANSYFTQKHLLKWGIKSTVMYPYIDPTFLDVKIDNKRPLILSVGRFFNQLHSKNHEKMIDIFLSHQNKFNKHTLILAGGLKEEDKNYYSTLLEKIEGKKNIILKPNIPFSELLKLYSEAQYYWHFTGYEINELQYPEQVEHLGITPLEAMAAGCIVFCVNAGGPKELIVNNINGYLFSTEKELLKKMQTVQQDEKIQKSVSKNARLFIQKNFTYTIFRENFKKLLYL